MQFCAMLRRTEGVNLPAMLNNLSVYNAALGKWDEVKTVYHHTVADRTQCKCHWQWTASLYVISIRARCSTFRCCYIYNHVNDVYMEWSTASVVVTPVSTVLQSCRQSMPDKNHCSTCWATDRNAAAAAKFLSEAQVCVSWQCLV